MGVRSNPQDHGRFWDATKNYFAGCIIADPSCLYCYAPVYAAGAHSAADLELYRGTFVFRNGRWTWSGVLTVLRPDHPDWYFPLGWKGVENPVLGAGRPSLLWVNSMADIFLPHPWGRPIEAIDRLFNTVAISPHIGLLLQHRVEPMVAYFSTKPDWWKRQFILVFSAGDQRWFDRRWQLIRPLAESGWIIGVSLQPMLGPVVLPPDFLAWLNGARAAANKPRQPRDESIGQGRCVINARVLGGILL